MGGLLALLLLGVIVAVAGAPTTPQSGQKMLDDQTAPSHWHVLAGGKEKFFFEEIGTSPDGYALLQWPFCETQYVKRN